MPGDIMHQLAAATGMLDDPSKKAAGAGLKEAPRVLLVTTVDIGGGLSERIEVRAGEDPIDVARLFCAKHGLPEAIIGPLAAHLDDNMKKAVSQQGGKSSDGRSSPHGNLPPGSPLGPPMHTESPKPAAGGMPPPPTSAAGAIPASATGGGSQPGHKPQYSFGSGMDEQLYEHLSSKLLDESQAPSARHARGNWVSATEMLSGPGSKRSSSGLSGVGTGRPGGATGPSPRDSVHVRLYATAQERSARHAERRKMADAEVVASLAAGRTSMSWVSAEMMRGRGQGASYDNYGEMLYAEGVEALMGRLKKAELERKAREDKELEGVTFAPAITKKAWELKQRERSSGSGVGLGLGGSIDGSVAGEDAEKWQRLYSRGMRKSTLERLEQLRSQREAAEVAECTFRPRINKHSDSLMNERAETLKVLNITHHEQLFADALRRQAKLDELQRWYPDGVTFQPQVNKDPRAQEYLRRSWERSSKQAGSTTTTTTATAAPSTGPGAAASTAASTASPRGGPAVAQPPQMSVVERLYAEAEKKAAKLEAARQLLHGPVDPATGKTLFQPETGRGPRGGVARHSAARASGGHIGEHLYRAAQELAAKRAAAEEAERRAADEEASRSRTTNVSQRLFTDLKLKRFRQIFEYLDEHGSGVLDLLAVLGRAPPSTHSTEAGAGPEAGGEGPNGEARVTLAVRHPRVDNLDTEVLMDVEAAADVWARANGLLLSKEERGLQSGSPRDTQAADQSHPSSPSAGPAGSLLSPGSSGCLAGPCPPLSLEMFMSCMEEALRMRRGPRAYLVPSPSAKQVPQHSFRPAINPRSRALAAKSRPDAASTFELLHRVAAQTADRLEAMRRDKEAAGLEGCTFAPQLNANKNVGGRALSRAMTRSVNGRPGSGDPASGFAAAAAGIAAAAEGGPGALVAAQAAADQERADLQRQLAELRAATEAAVGMQADLLAAAAEGGEGGEEEGGEDVAAFSLLEQELRDMQALTRVAMEDNDRRQQELAERQEAAAREAAQVQAQVQQQQQQGPSAGGVPPGGLQELAAALGVTSWQGPDAAGH
ncbi:hypothetical protein HYH03_004431 [Edaphochlamys debaryana]|uniref:EF-hand domain-containing protein n=1 Tax=Edaphochlamys debaryana TaxID=47281 RepID=A0A836C3H6_9CHLO|nr:hypothetical protein HYH03_004431 [Edaphochlamys debaryana]|eukprot:KAG2497694.1 hypothetical protein HYH03_004431 [Edaphochlamys debaryana]